MSDTRIKIVSNPYQRSISYQRWDETAATWRAISSVEEYHSRLHSGDFVRGFFPFKAEEIVRCIIEENRAGTQEITIVFEGCSDEYEELCAVCEAEDIARVVKLERSPQCLLNARDVLPEIQQMFMAVRRLHDDLTLFVDEDINRQLEQFYDVSKDIIPICVLGNYSSGKSTFVNALIGQELLPSGDEPVTARVYQIRRSVQQNEGSIEFVYDHQPVRLVFDEGGFVFETSRAPQSLLTQIQDAICGIDEEGIVAHMNCSLDVINGLKSSSGILGVSNRIDITAPFSVSDSWWRSHEFAIFDTPGYNSASNEDHAQVLRDAMRGMSNGLLVYVSEYDSLDGTDNIALYEEIASIDAIDERFAVIVVNKADAARIRIKEFTKDKRDQIMDWAVPRSLYAQGIYFVSSVMGLGAKIDGEFIDEFYAEVYEDNERKYSNPKSRLYKTLYRFNLLPHQIEERVVRESQECEDIILANSGLYCLEREIVRFAERYSVYNKCQRAQQLLNEIIDMTRARLESTQSYLEKKTLERELQFNDLQLGLLLDLESVAKKQKKDTLQRYWLYAPLKHIPPQHRVSTYMLRDLGVSRSSDELLEVVKSRFNAAVDELTKMAIEKSRVLIEEEMNRCVDALVALATSKRELPKEHKERIANVIASCPPPHVEFRIDVQFKKKDFQRWFKLLLIIPLFRMKKLDLYKLATAYENSLWRCVDMINGEVGTKYIQAFQVWLDDLEQRMTDNIVAYNPELLAMQRRINEDKKRVEELNARLETLKRYSDDVASFIGWW